MPNKINRSATKDIVETMKEINEAQNMNLGIDSIEFPDGAIEKFYYNGEEDRQAAIQFATICVNATTDTVEAKRMMRICFYLKVNGINPERIIMLDKGKELYLDIKKKALYDGDGSAYVKLTDEEKKVKMSADALALLLKERANKKYEDELHLSYDYDDSCDDEDECDGNCNCCCYHSCIYD